MIRFFARYGVNGAGLYAAWVAVGLCLRQDFCWPPRGKYDELATVLLGITVPGEGGTSEDVPAAD